MCPHSPGFILVKRLGPFHHLKWSGIVQTISVSSYRNTRAGLLLISNIC